MTVAARLQVCIAGLILVFREQTVILDSNLTVLRSLIATLKTGIGWLSKQPGGNPR